MAGKFSFKTPLSVNDKYVYFFKNGLNEGVTDKNLGNGNRPNKTWLKMFSDETRKTPEKRFKQGYEIGYKLADKLPKQNRKSYLEKNKIIKIT